MPSSAPMTNLRSVRMFRFAYVLLFCTAVGPRLHAQMFATVASFEGTNGAFPQLMSLVHRIDGHLYGTTAFGGSIVCGFRSAAGFSNSPQKVHSALNTFSIPSRLAPMSYPASGLLLAIDGTLALCEKEDRVWPESGAWQPRL
jgi:hypothetical protein